MSPELQQSMSGLTLPNGWQVTSLISGGHKGWGHAHGAAVDVSGDKTPQSWQWLIDQIQSGRWKHIGTGAEYVGQEAFAQLKQYGQNYGVDVFDDPGTGFHVHLQAFGPL